MRRRGVTEWATLLDWVHSKTQSRKVDVDLAGTLVDSLHHQFIPGRQDQFALGGLKSIIDGHYLYLCARVKGFRG